MSAITFAQSIIGKLESSIGTSGKDFTATSAGMAMAAVAQAISEYIVANTTVTVSYAGVMTATGTPDPMVLETFTVTGQCAPTGPSDSFDGWIHQIESNIIAGFMLSQSGLKGLGFVQSPFLTPGIAISQSNLKSTHDVSDTNPQLKVWTVVCQGIMDWINGPAMNPTPGPASFPALSPTPVSSGVATITKIIIV